MPSRRALPGVLLAIIATAALLVPAPAAHAVPGLPDIATECKPRPGGYRCFFGPFKYKDTTDDALVVTGLAWAIPEAGYITSMQARLVNQYGDDVPRHGVHLHHAVWLNPNKKDLTCPDFFGYGPDRFFATGKERTKIELPDGFGYHWDAEPLAGVDAWGPRWAMNTHLHWMHGDEYTPDVRIRFDIGFVPEAEAGPMEDVVPIWFDIDNCGDSEWDVPGDPNDGKRYRATWDYTMPMAGRFIALGGHLHDGGVKLGLYNRTRGENVYTSRAVYKTKRPRKSDWDLRKMTVYTGLPGSPVGAGDELRLNAVYDNKQPWPDVMGIMIGAFVPDP